MMKLFGSGPSPFVRRIRMLLADRPFEFVTLNIFEQQDRAVLIQHNPARKVPMLQDGDQVIFDSNVIYRYLAAKFGFPTLTWAEENQLTLINAVNDSLVELLLCQRSGFDTKDDKLFFKLQHERIQAILPQLDQDVASGKFSNWNFVSISLYALIDWMLFRELVDLTPYPALLQYLKQFADQPAVKTTDPRLA
jgi:glutathione S-transferase